MRSESGYCAAGYVHHSAWAVEGQEGFTDHPSLQDQHQVVQAEMPIWFETYMFTITSQPTAVAVWQKEKHPMLRSL